MGQGAGVGHRVRAHAAVPAVGDVLLLQGERQGARVDGCLCGTCVRSRQVCPPIQTQPQPRHHSTTPLNTNPQIFIVSSERIQARGYGTLFKFVTKSPSSFYSRAITSFPENLQPLVYMGFHLAMTTLTMALCAAWWASETAASAFIVTVFAVASWNGANFYFEVFAKRYLQDLGLSPAAAAAAAGGCPVRAPGSRDKKVS